MRKFKSILASAAISILLSLTLSLSLLAQSTSPSPQASFTTLTGTFLDSGGSPVSGQLRLHLPFAGMITAEGSAVSPSPVTYRIYNGSIVGYNQVIPNADLLPANSYYVAELLNSSGELIEQTNLFISFGPTFNIGTAILTSVTTGNISYTNPTFTNNPIWNPPNPATFPYQVNVGGPLVIGPESSPAGISGFMFNTSDPIGLCNAYQNDQLVDSIDPSNGQGGLAFNNCNFPGSLTERLMTRADQSTPFSNGQIWCFSATTGLAIACPNITFSPSTGNPKLSGCATGTVLFADGSGCASVSGTGTLNASGTITPNYISVWVDSTHIKSVQMSGDSTMSGTGVVANIGLDSIPLCNGFSPSNNNALTLTTSSSPNPCWTAVTPSGSVSNQIDGFITYGAGTSTLSHSGGGIFTSSQSGTTPNDLSGRVIAAFNACSTTTSAPCNILIDECGTQTWSVQPFENASGSPRQGYVRVWANGTCNKPLNILLDGVSTIEMASGIIIDLGGSSGSSAGASGVSGNTGIDACNPEIQTCANGGFVQQHGSITGTSYSSNVLTVTVSGAPFNVGSTVPPPSTPSTCVATGTPITCYGNNAIQGGYTPSINGMWQWRIGCITYSTDVSNNGCYMYKATVTSTGNQVFQFYIASTSGQSGTPNVTTCTTGCGTLVLDTPMVIDNNTGNAGGIYETQFAHATLNCNFLPGCGGFVKSGGEELTAIQYIQVFNALVYGDRWDQSPAYGAQINGDTNDGGPNGPLSANLNPVECQTGGTCSCVSTGGSGLCPGGTAAVGTKMFCNSSSSAYAVISPDPCMNTNYICGLFTGGSGNQMPGLIVHQTCSISDFAGVGVQELKGFGSNSGCSPTAPQNCGGPSQAIGVGVFGSGAIVQGWHEEFFNVGFQFCGDPNIDYTYWAAYQNVTTSSVSIEEGFNGPSNLYFDIGPGNSSASNCGGIHIHNAGGGTTGLLALIDQVSGHSLNSSAGGNADVTVNFDLGTGNIPNVKTGGGGEEWLGPVSFSPGQCAGGIGQSTSTNYGLPPYVKTNTSNACTTTTLMGPLASHSCIAENFYVTMGHTPAAGDTVNFFLEDVTTSTATLTCGINSSSTGTGQVSTTSCKDTGNWFSGHPFKVSQGDQVYPFYTVSQATDGTATDIQVTWDCQ